MEWEESEEAVLGQGSKRRLSASILLDACLSHPVLPFWHSGEERAAAAVSVSLVTGVLPRLFGGGED